MNIFDYTEQGRRPSARQIVSDWKKAGEPGKFQVEYGETFAEFEMTTYGWDGSPSAPKWYANGNGCRGVDRDAVMKLLGNNT